MGSALNLPNYKPIDTDRNDKIVLSDESDLSSPQKYKVVETIYDLEENVDEQNRRVLEDELHSLDKNIMEQYNTYEGHGGFVLRRVETSFGDHDFDNKNRRGCDTMILNASFGQQSEDDNAEAEKCEESSAYKSNAVIDQ